MAAHNHDLSDPSFPTVCNVDQITNTLYYCGAVSRLTAKLINRRISEKTCLVALASPRGGVSAPEGVVLSGGDPSVARSASPAPVPGKETRLPLGEVRRPRVLDVGGSISRFVRNDVCSSSGFVLVMVTKKSSRSFCSARGVPFKSMI
jgi:hypothetical protein